MSSPKPDSRLPAVLRLPFDDVTLAQLTYRAGRGSVERRGQGLRLEVSPPEQNVRRGPPYCNAQLDDYHADNFMRWRPPVRMTVRARLAPGAQGTAGFGFWNDPAGMTGRARLRLPQAAWFFFGSPPNDLKFARDVPGHGWKAAAIDAATPLTVFLLPLAPAAFLAFRWGWLYRRLWPAAERLWRIVEGELPVDPAAWHTYELVWTPERLTWRVDGETVLASARPPKGPLGFVAWIDNQYLVATPQGKFAHGTLAADTQWLELDRLEVTPLAG